MALVLPRSIFFHLPKTGGTFVRRTIEDLGIPAEEVGDVHEDVLAFSRLHPELLGNRYVFTFVRHPLSWWQSYWAHRFLHGWAIDHPMDRECNDNDFSRYLSRVLACEWRTHYMDMYRAFVVERTDFVGRQEHLVQDLARALVNAGEKFDVASVGRLGFTNRSPSHRASCPGHLRRSVEDVHKELIARFYPRSASLWGRLLHRRDDYRASNRFALEEWDIE